MMWDVSEINFDDNDNFVFENGVLFDKNKEQLVCYDKKLEASEYIVPESVNTLCEFAFYGNEFLENIIIPKSVTNISNSAIRNCNSLKSISYMGSQEEWESINTDFNFEADISGLNVVFDYIPETKTGEELSESLNVNDNEDGDELPVLDEGEEKIGKTDGDFDNSYVLIVVLISSIAVILIVVIIIFHRKKSKKKKEQ